MSMGQRVSQLACLGLCRQPNVILICKSLTAAILGSYGANGGMAMIHFKGGPCHSLVHSRSTRCRHEAGLQKHC